MIEFQKEYLNIIEQQNNSKIIMQAAGLGQFINFFTTQGSMTGDALFKQTPQQSVNAINDLDGKMHSGCSYINTAVDYIKEKGNVVSNMVQAPFKAIHNGKNVQKATQITAKHAGQRTEVNIQNGLGKQCDKLGFKIQGINTESISFTKHPQYNKIIKQSVKDFVGGLKQIIYEDAKRGITPNMWFDSTAKPQDQIPIIFENSMITFKTEGSILICQQISTKTNKKHLICQSLLNQARLGVLAYLEKIGVSNAIADKAIPNTGKYDYALLKANGVSDNQIRVIKDVVSKYGEKSGADSKFINDLHNGNIDLTTGKIKGSGQQPLGSGLPPSQSPTPAASNNGSNAGSTNSGNITPASDNAKPSTTPPATGPAGENPKPAPTSNFNTSGGKAGWEATKGKGIWAKIKFIGKWIFDLICKLVALICQVLIWVILCIFEVFKGLVTKNYDFGSLWGRAGGWVNGKIGSGIIKCLVGIGLFKLITVGISAIINWMTSKASAEDPKSAETKQLIQLQQNADLSIIADFEV